jgi:hypothetical protein
LRQFAALTWALGLSLEQVVSVFEDFGVNLSRTTVWRDGQEIIPRLPDSRRARLVRMLDPENSGVWIEDHQGGVIIILELKRKKKVLLEMVEEDDIQEVRHWLEPIARELNLNLEVF